MEAQHRAVLCIDFVNDLVHENGKFVAPELAERLRQSSMLGNAARVLTSARNSGVPVIHAGLSFEPGHGDLNPHVPLVAPAREHGALLGGCWGSELHDVVRAGPGEIVITKKGISAFSGTSLQKILVMRGITTLVLMGFSTNWSVEGSARDAADLSYQVVTLTDCCESYSGELQQFAVSSILPMLGRVSTADEIIEEFVAAA